MTFTMVVFALVAALGGFAAGTIRTNRHYNKILDQMERISDLPYSKAHK